TRTRTIRETVENKNLVPADNPLADRCLNPTLYPHSLPRPDRFLAKSLLGYCASNGPISRTPLPAATPDDVDAPSGLIGKPFVAAQIRAAKAQAAFRSANGAGRLARSPSDSKFFSRRASGLRIESN